MQRTPWHTDHWFTSPWNHDPAVAADYRFPDQVTIHDVTLRDGEQQAGVEFTAEQKLRIAEGLAEAGIQRIEAGLPAVSPEDEKAVRMIVDAGLPSTIYAFSRCMVDDVKRAVDCGVTGVVMEVPSSRHLIEKGYRWTVERAIEASVESTAYAHEQGLLVTFFPIDATRASLEDYISLVGQVADAGHMDALALVDTMGALGPHAVATFAKASRERWDVPLETHMHMDFGLGVANTVLAVAAGASVVQTTIAGIGERAGNTPMEETVMALRTLYDVDCGLDLSKLKKLAAAGRRALGRPAAAEPARDRRPPLRDRVGDHRDLGAQLARRGGGRGRALRPAPRRPGPPPHRAGQGQRRGQRARAPRAPRPHGRRGPGAGAARPRQGGVAGQAGPAGARRVPRAGRRRPGVILHVVLMRFPAPGDAEEAVARARVMAAQIPEVRRCTAGRNVVPGPNAHDVLLQVELDDLEALDRYRAHPAHEEAAAFFRARRSAVASLDVEVAANDGNRSH